MFEWNIYLLLLFLLGGVFIALVVYALRWAFRDGQFNNLDAGSRVIFDEEEPEGEVLDSFPAPRKRRPKAGQ